MKKFNNRIKKGFTLAEMLVVLTIVGILITISLPAVAQGNHRRKFDSYSTKILGDLRWAFNESSAKGEELVLEVVGFYHNQTNTGHPFPLEDVIRVWKKKDWEKYLDLSMHKSPNSSFDLEFAAPYLVYDLSESSNLNENSCFLDGTDAASNLVDCDYLISEDELPVPLREYVKEDYKDPPMLLELAEYQAVLTSKKFKRIRNIPREIDLISPFVDQSFYDGSGLVNYENLISYAVIRPEGNAESSTGVLTFAFMLKPEYFTERILSLANNKTENSSRFKCAMEANLQSKSNGRTVQLMLSSGGVRITEASPTEYMDPNRQSSCSTSMPDSEWSLDFDRGTGWR
ncbi:hypothetical protein CL645_00105 [bacterium]|nr:hypothetical protein [bacterium]|tara:strand:- start:274 stop:1305 length:1032 start_codon:yes stop_codon:yes gene_type:complete